VTAAPGWFWPHGCCQGWGLTLWRLGRKFRCFLWGICAARLCLACSGVVAFSLASRLRPRNAFALATPVPVTHARRPAGELAAADPAPAVWRPNLGRLAVLAAAPPVPDCRRPRHLRCAYLVAAGRCCCAGVALAAPAMAVLAACPQRSAWAAWPVGPARLLSRASAPFSHRVAARRVPDGSRLTLRLMVRRPLPVPPRSVHSAPAGRPLGCRPCACAIGASGQTPGRAGATWAITARRRRSPLRSSSPAAQVRVCGGATARVPRCATAVLVIGGQLG